MSDVLQAWTAATGDIELKCSRVHGGPPTGPLIRYLLAALTPIIGRSMIGVEALIKMIRDARR